MNLTTVGDERAFVSAFLARTDSKFNFPAGSGSVYGTLRGAPGPQHEPSTHPVLTTSTRVGTRKERRSHSSAESQKAAALTPLRNWMCLDLMLSSVTVRMEKELDRKAIPKRKLTTR